MTECVRLENLILEYIGSIGANVLAMRSAITELIKTSKL